MTSSTWPPRASTARRSSPPRRGCCTAGASNVRGVRDRFRGCLLGLAVGDAVGTTVEFSPPGSFEPVTDMVGGGPFSLPAGAWTDDTSMALCLAESLVKCGGVDPLHPPSRHLRRGCGGDPARTRTGL